MKTGGQSWNKSGNHKRGLDGKYTCSECGRQYKQSWTKDNQDKLCKERFK